MIHLLEFGLVRATLILPQFKMRLDDSYSVFSFRYKTWFFFSFRCKTLEGVCLLIQCTWKPAYGTGIDCKPGCHSVNGYCEKPGECRCNEGWRGALCNKCVRFPGCLHGSCNKPWQCVCEEGWVGSLCDIDIHPCAVRPCANNSTCIETRDGGYICVCAQGYTGKNCHQKKGPCYTSGSPCQNGGTCVDGNGFAHYTSCMCPPGFTGDFCEIRNNDCNPSPCENGGVCTNIGSEISCLCPSGYIGPSCSTRVIACLSDPCENGGTCLEHPGGRFNCICKPEFVGDICSHLKRNMSRFVMNTEVKHKQHHNLHPNVFHKSTHQQEHEVLKITLKETVQHSGILLNKSQVICFIVLGLLTCLVVLVTTGIVFFSKCEMWLANAKYSHLIRKQRNRFMKSNSGEELSVNIIFPEKIKLTNYSKSYTSI
ncbi:protein delta homolog 1 isoform X2 [Latimeria chalumnae]|uniref:protein delta homolog 1 isoform X2 n=1 Tax=Latimeria chalumnae TaxID=7897 RepID=UPI0006D91F3D|nr:PREDICTED: protein delta homolog 1 isoform X2 [Latimeria chalumnae]|eukprot:XP_014347223.1 PREDICTED: protein delta homolog 1 isoform X2 [Latimeria chalumnae]